MDLCCLSGYITFDHSSSTQTNKNRAFLAQSDTHTSHIFTANYRSHIRKKFNGNYCNRNNKSFFTFVGCGRLWLFNNIWKRKKMYGEKKKRQEGNAHDAVANCNCTEENYFTSTTRHIVAKWPMWTETRKKECFCQRDRNQQPECRVPIHCTRRIAYRVICCFLLLLWRLRNQFRFQIYSCHAMKWKPFAYNRCYKCTSL